MILETENVISSEEMEAPLEEKTTVPGTENIPEESTEQTETAQITETVMPETVETSAETIPETFSEAESSSAREEETEPSSTESMALDLLNRQQNHRARQRKKDRCLLWSSLILIRI